MGYLLNKFEFPSSFCRSAYCPECAKKGRPQINDSFMIIGSSRKEYWKSTCERLIPPSDFGFTPHLFLYQQEFDTERDSYAVFFFFFLMNGCGITLFENSEGKLDYSFHVEDPNLWTMATMSYDSGFALYALFSDSGYELDWKYLKRHKNALISPDLNYLNLRRLYADKEKRKIVFTAR